MKSNFNKKVFDLRQHKIKLVHDYKQFKFDVCIIQNELNEPETRTPSNFPKVFKDESIDVRYKYLLFLLYTNHK